MSTNNNSNDSGSGSELTYPTTDNGYSGLDIELSRYTLGIIDIILHEHSGQSELYKTSGCVETVEKAVEHDGPVVQDGHFRRFELDDDESKLATSYHPVAGVRDYYAVDEEFNQPVVLLTELEHTPVERTPGE